MLCGYESRRWRGGEKGFRTGGQGVMYGMAVTKAGRRGVRWTGAEARQRESARAEGSVKASGSRPLKIR